jgi:SAM-dependent methyltransferase
MPSLQRGREDRSKVIDTAELQRAHYDRISAEYELHYSDEWSQRYRRRFINEPLTRGLDLRDCDVLDAMCGSGQMAAFLLDAGARVTGLDVSAEVMAQFADKLPKATPVRGSILNSGFADAFFDHVFVVGGLHHVHPNVDEAIDEIHRILRPGGAFCFAEPHAGSLPDLGRRFWYRYDRLFEANEAGIDLEQLKATNASRFEFELTTYTGALGYLLVYNSFIFRVPLQLKRRYSPPILRLEALVEPLQGRLTSCMVLSRWWKRPN